MKQLQKFFESKPYLAWYVKNKNNLSEKSMLENVLNYGDWEDFEATKKALGIKSLRVLFGQLLNQKRVNLKPKTINYFKNYFQKYA